MLYGVLYHWHHGVPAGGGHHTLHVLHPDRDHDGSAQVSGNSNGEAWLHIDDELETVLSVQ